MVSDRVSAFTPLTPPIPSSSSSPSMFTSPGPSIHLTSLADSQCLRMPMEVVADFMELRVKWGGWDYVRKMNRLLHANTDTAVLVETVENVSLFTWHDLLERRGITLGKDNTYSLVHLSVQNEHFSRIEEE